MKRLHVHVGVDNSMMAHPILINRPIVVTDKAVKLCGPSEAVLDILRNLAGSPLPKAGREADVEARGKPVADAAP